jgi:hypothetical protein
MQIRKSSTVVKELHTLLITRIQLPISRCCTAKGSNEIIAPTVNVRGARTFQSNCRNLVVCVKRCTGEASVCQGSHSEQLVLPQTSMALFNDQKRFALSVLVNDQVAL